MIWLGCECPLVQLLFLDHDNVEVLRTEMGNSFLGTTYVGSQDVERALGLLSAPFCAVA